MMMTLTRCLCVATLICTAGCAKGDKPPLTKEAFARAVAKCQPLSASFSINKGAPPSVGITIASAPSAVPDCMAKSFEDFSIKELEITYARTGEVPTS